jgi:hypothetical protein
MKRWQVLGAIFLPSAAFLLNGGQARAQGFDQLVADVAVVTVKSGMLVDALLGYWVQVNALTTQGGYLSDALAQTAVNTVHFLAQLVTLF